MSHVADLGVDTATWIATFKEDELVVNLDNFRMAGGAVNCYTRASFKVIDAIPFQFGKAFFDFAVTYDRKRFTMFKGLPYQVNGDFVLSMIETVGGSQERYVVYYQGEPPTPVEYLPRWIRGDCRLNGITSLANIHKHVDRIGGLLWVPHIKSHLLGVLLIDGIQEVRGLEDAKPGSRAIKIVNKYVGQGKAGVIAAQQELLDAGLDEYAQL